MVAAVVLAAGASTRFGSPKQRLLLPPVLERVRASSVVDTVVVLGAHEVATDARTVRCAGWARGAGASLRCGFEALSAEIRAAVVVLADGPDLSPAAIERLIVAWREGAGEVLAASYGGGRGHPVLLGRSVWALVPDEGARALEPVLVPCDDLGVPGDVDLPEDLPGRAFVTAVSRGAAHTLSKPNEPSIRLLRGLGVEGDAHAGETVKHRSRVARDPSQPNLRQVRLIHAELHDELRAAGFELAPGELGENVTTRGIDLLGLPTGALLRLGGSAVVRVLGLRNPCIQLNGLRPGLMAATLGRGPSGEVVRRAGVMGVVVAGGEIRPGDPIAVELPPEPHRRLKPV